MEMLHLFSTHDQIGIVYMQSYNRCLIVCLSSQTSHFSLTVFFHLCSLLLHGSMLCNTLKLNSRNFNSFSLHSFSINTSLGVRFSISQYCLA